MRRYGDAVAHSFGLGTAPLLRTASLRHPQVGISRLSIGPEQLGMSPSIPPEDTFIAAMYLTEVPHHELWSHGRRVLSQGYAPHALRIVNLADEYSARISCPHESLGFYIPRAAIDEFTDEAGSARISHLACPPGIIDAVIANLARALLPAFQRPHEVNALFVDHVVLSVLAHLCNHYADHQLGHPYLRGGMTRLQIERAKDFLVAHCSEDVTLLDVAQACGLSRGHFAKAFRTSTGVTPHHWLQRYRVDKARSLLVDGSLSLADIAMACGFADQSHFTRVFARLIGATPAVWRRQNGKRPS